jgi:hypothetical protein
MIIPNTYGIVRKMQKQINKRGGKRKFKKILPNILLLLATIIIFFLIGEILSRLIIGNRLIMQWEEDGFYHWESNQDGWYRILSKAKINNIGARGEPVEIDFIKNNSKYVFLGDSFTFGWGLDNDNETIPSYFQRFMNLTNGYVINYAAGGYGIEHMIASYDYYNEFFKEGDSFIIIIFEDDFGRVMSPTYKSSIRDFSWNLIKRYSSLISFLYDASNISPLLQKIIYGEDYGGDRPGINDEDLEKVSALNNLLGKNNQTLVIVFYEYNATDYSEKAKDFCEENKINCITNVPTFINNLKGNEKIYSVDEIHPSKHSNRVVSEGITNFIKENNLSLA